MSDPRFISTIVDLVYTPSASSDDKGYLDFIPNIYDPVRPLPINITPEKLMKVYQIMFEEEPGEDAALYRESTTNTPPEWFVYFPEIFVQQKIVMT